MCEARVLGTSRQDDAYATMLDGHRGRTMHARELGLVCADFDFVTLECMYPMQSFGGAARGLDWWVRFVQSFGRACVASVHHYDD